MESYWWGLYVAGLVFFFGGLIEMATYLSKKPSARWVLSIVVGIVLSVTAASSIFYQ